MKTQMQISCPAMAVRFHAKGYMLTDNLDASGWFNDPSGKRRDFGINFPPTLVREKSLLLWIVDAVVAAGPIVGGGMMMNNLAAEPCRFTLLPTPHIIAEALTANGRIVLADGTQGACTVNYPDAPSYWQKPGEWLVDAIVAPGTVTWP